MQQTNVCNVKRCEVAAKLHLSHNFFIPISASGDTVQAHEPAVAAVSIREDVHIEQSQKRSGFGSAESASIFSHTLQI